MDIKMNGYRSEQDLIRNLKDAGCDEDSIQCILEKLGSGKQNQGIPLLQKHRRGLLENLHKCQEQIDCLDYMLYMMKKQSKEDEVFQKSVTSNPGRKKR